MSCAAGGMAIHQLPLALTRPNDAGGVMPAGRNTTAPRPSENDRLAQVPLPEPQKQAAECDDGRSCAGAGPSWERAPHAASRGAGANTGDRAGSDRAATNAECASQEHAR